MKTHSHNQVKSKQKHLYQSNNFLFLASAFAAILIWNGNLAQTTPFVFFISLIISWEILKKINGHNFLMPK